MNANFSLVFDKDWFIKDRTKHSSNTLLSSFNFLWNYELFESYCVFSFLYSTEINYVSNLEIQLVCIKCIFTYGRKYNHAVKYFVQTVLHVGVFWLVSRLLMAFFKKFTIFCSWTCLTFPCFHKILEWSSKK